MRESRSPIEISRNATCKSEWWQNRKRLVGAQALTGIFSLSGMIALSGVALAQPPNSGLPPGESVIPLPAVPAPKGFQGFGDHKIDTTEELPNPNLPPAYQFPSPAKTNAPAGRLGSPTTDPSSTYLSEQPSWQDLTKTPSNIDHWQRYLQPQVPAQSITFAKDAKMQSAEPWTMINEDARQQLDELANAPPPSMDGGVRLAPCSPSDFAPTPFPSRSWNPVADMNTYYAKTAIPTQRPWVEWWRPFYAGGVFSPAIPVFSDVNPLTPQFLLYGDYRTAIGIHRNAGQPNRNWAHRLNLEADLRLTGTERFHVGLGPLDNGNEFTRLDFSDDFFFDTHLDAQPNTAFFEGDLGAMVGGIRGIDAPFDLPVTAGLIPLLYQNGIWMEDAILGVACAIPWQHSKALNWANYDATFFAGFNDITSPAFGNDDSAAQVFGTAWFIEAYEGYIEADYAYLNDIVGLDRDYHNFSIGFTRRYFHRISNSVRFLANLGQEGPRVNRSADGGLIILENSWIGRHPSTVVPYFNTFLGYGTPQSVARAGGSGGILRNVGLNFETDGLTGYPTLDATGSNAYGGAIGINLLTSDFRRQLAFEFAAQDTYGDPLISRAAGAEYGFGTRFQQSLTNWSLIRIDLMAGLLDRASDIYGSRIEYRWKF